MQLLYIISEQPYQSFYQCFLHSCHKISYFWQSIADDQNYIFPSYYLSRSLKMDLIFIFLFIFIFIFFFIFDLFSIFRTRVRVKWQRSRCHMICHIRWHSHKSHDAKKDVEGSGRMMSYNMIKYMLALWYTHGCLG